MGVKWKRFSESPSAWVIKGLLIIAFVGLCWVGTVFASNTAFRIENEPRMERMEKTIEKFDSKLDELLKRGK